MDNHLKHGLVNYNLHKVAVGKPSQNGLNAGKRCTWSTYTNVMGVLEPSVDNGDTGMSDSSLGNDRDCGKESIGWKAWQA